MVFRAGGGMTEKESEFEGRGSSLPVKLRFDPGSEVCYPAMMVVRRFYALGALPVHANWMDAEPMSAV